MIIEECDGDDSTSPAMKRKRQRRHQDQWTLHRDTESGDVAVVEENTSEIDQDCAKLPVIIKHLRDFTSRTLPQIQSRILHAASPILHELSRQYFLPFLTVALACLGRIHSCILKLGRDIVAALTEFIPRLRILSSSARNNSGAAGKIANIFCGREVCKELECSVRPIFTVLEPKSRLRHLDVKKDEQQIKAEGEWNALMSHFLELSHHDLTNRTNQFVKERRWKDMLSSCGLKDADNKSGSVEEQVDEKEANDSGFVGYSSANESPTDDSVQLHNIVKSTGGNDEECDHIDNDTGEAIDEKIITNAISSNSDPSETVDDNMARILKLQKERKRALSQKISESTLEGNSEFPIEEPSNVVSSSRKKKKRKKKNKKRKSEESDIEGGDQQLDKEDRKTENYQPMETPEKVDVTKAALNAEEMIVTTATRELPKEATVANNSEDITPDKKTKKVKSMKELLSKEATKKKKRKKKSSNVIDEIFG